MFTSAYNRRSGAQTLPLDNAPTGRRWTAVGGPGGGKAMSQVPAGVTKIEEHDPEFLNDLAATAADAFAPGAL